MTDASTGETLPGVNVSIVGTTQGAVTDVNGNYNILNVRPGTYGVQASFVGFQTATREEVRVSTDLTTTIDFALQEAAFGLDEVFVVAEQPIVQADVSANVANLSSQDFQDLPVAGVSEVLDLQAGIEPGMQVRGGGLNEIAFIVDGLSMRTGRGNEPMTNVSYTSLEEVQVQTGGFSAEYGNVRSGIVNIATKEPPRDRYTVDALFRYAPAQDKTFDAYHQLGDCSFSGDRTDIPVECDTWFSRPLLDPEVRDVGVQNTDIWDSYQSRQYLEFEGWNSVVSRLRDKGFDVNNDDMVEYWRYMWRKDNEISIPDYDADITVGGPVPGISGMLGDLRFLASYRGTQTSYLYPQPRDGYTDNTYSVKMISNLSPGMKLTGHYIATRERGQTRSENLGYQGTTLWKGNLPAYPWWEGQNDVGHQVINIDIRADELFTDGQFPRGDIDHNIMGLQFTHTLNQNTFYEVGIQRMASKYRTRFPSLRDGSYLCPDSGQGPDGQSCEAGAMVRVPWTDQFGNVTPGFENLIGQDGGVTCFGGNQDYTGDGENKAYCVGQEPFGYSGIGANLETGESTGGHWVGARDTSDVDVWTGRFDLTSQVNHFLMLQTGAELIYNNFDMRTMDINLELAGPESGARWIWDGSPIQGAAYVQGKLEFEGMVANLGARLEYLDPNTEWWEYDAYPTVFRFQPAEIDAALEKSSVSSQVALSPRIGVSFPITTDSKLYFNYGHFRQMLDPYFLIGMETSKSGGINEIGNPNHPFPKTVAYELGYDQNLFDRYLLRISGFYRDKTEQSRTVDFTSLGGVVNYETRMPWDFGDVRGAEVSLSKNRGECFQGIANFTFKQRKDGFFGYSNFFENSFQMVSFLRDATDYRLQAPVAEPFARLNARFITPQGFGPEVAGANPLAGFLVSFLAEWRRGQTLTWQGGASIPEINNNVRYQDFWNLDLRVTKYLNAMGTEMQLFADVSNVLNLRHLNFGGAFIEGQGRDREDYMRSLHLAEDIFDQLPEGQSAPYRWVPGDDKPGTYREWDVEFQPIEAYATLPDAPQAGFERQWAWTEDTGDYFQWNGSSWEEVPGSEVDQVLDDKAYIDMPNHRFNTFLNPRRVTFGVRVSF
ncbi:MAG: carboxypeptidase-like regulatory domain-containing protein [Rhodothermales bacterium]